MSEINREAAMTEAYSRGILPERMAKAYEEAQRRRLLGTRGNDSSITPIDDAPAQTHQSETFEDRLNRNSREFISDNNIKTDENGLMAWDDPHNQEYQKLVGTGRGFMDAWEGAKQLALQAGEKMGLISPEDRARWEQAVEQERQTFERDMGDSNAATVGRLVGNTLPYAAIPGPGAGAGVLSKIAHGAATGGAIGATQYVPDGESRTENAALGAAAGAGGAAVLEGASRVAGRVVNAARGKMASAEADGLQRLSAEHDVPLSYGDIQGGSIAPKVETATEYVPGVGMGKFREVQHQKAEGAARKLVDDLKPIDDDWATIAQGSLRRKAVEVRSKAAESYDRVAQFADPLGEVPTTSMNKAAKDIITAEMKKPEAYRDEALIKAIGKYTENPQTNFTGLRAIRSDLGDEIADYYRGANGLVGRKGARHLQAIKSAMENDLESFSKQNGNGLRTAWKLADSYYKNRVVPFKDSALANAAKSDTPDEIYRKFIQRDKRDRARKFYAAMDTEGRQAIRYKMVEDAYEQASRGEHFSPATFARKLEDIEKATGVFFRGPDKKRLNGLTKLMRHAQRAGQYMENPPTGQRVIPYLAAGMAAIRPAEAAGAAGSAFIIKELTTKSWGKNLLLAASKVEPGSPAMQELLLQMETHLPRLGAAAATATDPRSPMQSEDRQSQQVPNEQRAAVQ